MDSGGLAGGWRRRRPGSPVYGTDLRGAQGRAALAFCRCLFVRNVFAPRAAADVDRAGHDRSALGAFLVVVVATGGNGIAIKYLAR